MSCLAVAEMHDTKCMLLEKKHFVVQVLYGGWPQDLRDEGPQRYGPKAAKWQQVREASLLGELLSQPDYVIPGVPVFFVVAKGTDYRERFLSDEIPLF